MCSTRLYFSVNDSKRCYSYNITDDSICELGMSATSFKVHLIYFSSDDETVLIKSGSDVATVNIDDTNEPECCKCSIIAKQ